MRKRMRCGRQELECLRLWTRRCCLAVLEWNPKLRLYSGEVGMLRSRRSFLSLKVWLPSMRLHSISKHVSCRKPSRTDQTYPYRSIHTDAHRLRPDSALDTPYPPKTSPCMFYCSSLSTDK